MDITHLQFEDELWADDGHLSAIGKMELSSYLLMLIQKIENAESSE